MRPLYKRRVDVARYRTMSWWETAVGLGATTFALGVALLVPRLFSDPNGVDPHDFRLAAVTLFVATVVAVRARFVGMRSLTWALCAIAVPFSLWSATPYVLTVYFRSHMNFPTQLCIASAFQLMMTFVFVFVIRLTVPEHHRPHLRLGSSGRSAALVAVAGVVAFVGIALALPAMWLGRVGIAPIAVLRDLPWGGPAWALLAVAQEIQFRGLLLGTCERVMSQRWANVVQALFFGLSHIAVQQEGPIGFFVPLVIALGLLFGWMTQKTQSLWPAIVIHVVADVAVAVAVVPGLYGY